MDTKNRRRSVKNETKHNRRSVVQAQPKVEESSSLTPDHKTFRPPSKVFRVRVSEVWYQEVEVQASTPEEAREKVKGGDGEHLSSRLEYSHTLGPDQEHPWEVSEAS
jgi:hypothetical protein